MLFPYPNENKISMVDFRGIKQTILRYHIKKIGKQNIGILEATKKKPE